MHLLYFDESGNTGLDLNNAQQPVFSLCAMIVAEDHWQSLESSLEKVLDKRFAGWRSIDGFEIHAADLRNGNGPFRGISVAERIAFRQEWMNVGIEHGVKVVYKTVHKRKYAEWLTNSFGAGVYINPHIAAFALLARCVDDYLMLLNPSLLGIIICDENKEIVADVEKSIRMFKQSTGVIKLNRIIEKGFFIDSSKSLPLQLCDLFAYTSRKVSEATWQLGKAKSFDQAGIESLRKVVHASNARDSDVLAWLMKDPMGGQKRSGQGSSP